MVQYVVSLQFTGGATTLRATFRGALRMVLEEQQRLVDVRAQRRLLLVLDEAATVASLDELDQMASTVSGLDVTLVTVLQDFSQLKAVGVLGPRPL